VILVISAMALPQITSMVARSNLNGAVASVSGAILTTRLRAMSAGVPFQVAFSASSKTYSIAYCSGCTSTSTTESYSTALPGYTNVPFAPSSKIVVSNDLTLYVRPGGVIQTVAATSTCPIPTATPTMTLTNGSLTQTITVSCYGKITLS